jgi:hypothetical protein
MKLFNLENYHGDKMVDDVMASEYLTKTDTTTHTTKL